MVSLLCGEKWSRVWEEGKNSKIIQNVTAMIKTEVYLTKFEKQQLIAISAKSGRKQSELIRDAIDSFIERFSSTPKDTKKILQKTAGMWKDRPDMISAEMIRRNWDREFE